MTAALSPFGQLERASPTLTYSVLWVLGGVALGLGGLVAAVSSSAEGMTLPAAILWALAVGTLIFSLSMAVLITLSFARRLEALVVAADSVLPDDAEPATSSAKGDAIAALARRLGRLTERVTELSAEVEQQNEGEQGRLDTLVRERTRALASENDDLRRALGDSKGLLSVDPDGRIVGQSSPVLTRWLGPMPASASFWEYFEQAAEGVGHRFEAAWEQVLGQMPARPELQRLPRNLAVGDRYLAIEYKAVQAPSGRLERVLLLLSDISIPEPDPATPG